MSYDAAGKVSKVEPIERISPKVNEQLAANLTLMGEMGGSATPVIYYMDDEGCLQQQQGAPRPDSLNQIMGRCPRSVEPRPSSQCRHLIK